MHKRQNNFARGPALVAAAAAVAAAFAPPASAQNAPTTAQTTERIEVTGTNIRRVEGEGALPVTVLSRQQIERTGATNAMELLNYVTANNSLGNISLTSVILIVHRRMGRTATAALAATALRAMIGFSLALLTLHLTVQACGAVLALGAALAVSVAWSAVLSGMARVPLRVATPVPR